MIFITTGTTKFSYDYVIEHTEKVLLKLNTKERLVIQSNRKTKHKFKYTKVYYYKEIPYDVFIKYLKKARVVITHAGPASINLALKYSKNIPIVIPRIRKLKEHVDNHQYYFAKNLERKKNVFLIFKREKIDYLLEKYIQNPKINHFSNKGFNNSIKKVMKKIDFFLNN